MPYSHKQLTASGRRGEKGTVWDLGGEGGYRVGPSRELISYVLDVKNEEGASTLGLEDNGEELGVHAAKR